MCVWSKWIVLAKDLCEQVRPPSCKMQPSPFSVNCTSTHVSSVVRGQYKKTREGRKNSPLSGVLFAIGAGPAITGTPYAALVRFGPQPRQKKAQMANSEVFAVIRWIGGSLDTQNGLNPQRQSSQQNGAPAAEREFPVLLMPAPKKIIIIIIALTREKQKKTKSTKHTPKEQQKQQQKIPKKYPPKKIALTRGKKPLA